MRDLTEFVKERNEALLSLDKEKIIRYANNYRIPLPKSEMAFWAAIHKAILQIHDKTEEQKSRSQEWLAAHGFSEDI